MNRFTRSWQLAQAAWQVLMSDKELALFPILSAVLGLIATLILVGVFMVIGVTLPGAQSLVNQAGGEEGSTLATVTNIAILFIFYLVSSFIVTYFTSGLVGAALMRLRGEDPTFGDGLRIANARLGAIFGYAVIAATVGVVLSLIRGKAEQRSIGRDLAASLGQAAWNLATFLAIPILVAQSASPFKALTESTQLLKKTWGEQIIGSGGIGLVFGLAIGLAVAGGAILTVVLAANEQAAAALAVLIVAILVVILLAIVQSALNGIYKAAVYLYAAEGVETAQFNPALVRTAFQPATA